MRGIFDVLIPEKSDEHVFFVRNSASEEAPRDPGVCKKAKHISQEDLGGYTPKEPSNVARMSTKAVNLTWAF